MDTIWATSFIRINTGKKFLNSGNSKVNFIQCRIIGPVDISIIQGRVRKLFTKILKSSTLSIALLRKVTFLCIVSGILWQVFLVLRWDQNFLVIRSGSSSLYKLSLIFLLHKFLKDLLLLLNFISLLILSARDLCDLFLAL